MSQGDGGMFGRLVGGLPAPLGHRARSLASSRRARWGLVLAIILVAWAASAALLPEGLPFGIVLLGLILGGLTSLTAMGLVIVYRSARIINFAQAEIGGLSAAVAVVMVTGS